MYSTLTCMVLHTRLVFMFCMYCFNLPPQYGKKNGYTQCVFPFPFVPPDPFFAARFFSLIRFLPGATKVHCAVTCFPSVHSHIFHFLPFFPSPLLLPYLPSSFPITSHPPFHFTFFLPIQKSMEKQDKCFAFGRCLRPRVSL